MIIEFVHHSLPVTQFWISSKAISVDCWKSIKQNTVGFFFLSFFGIERKVLNGCISFQSLYAYACVYTKMYLYWHKEWSWVSLSLPILNTNSPFSLPSSEMIFIPGRWNHQAISCKLSLDAWYNFLEISLTGFKIVATWFLWLQLSVL